MRLEQEKHICSMFGGEQVWFGKLLVRIIKCRRIIQSEREGYCNWIITVDKMILEMSNPCLNYIISDQHHSNKMYLGIPSDVLWSPLSPWWCYVEVQSVQLFCRNTDRHRQNTLVKLYEISLMLPYSKWGATSTNHSNIPNIKYFLKLYLLINHSSL